MRRRKQRVPLSMTSLIDVIFLLLLFFMLSSTFSKFGEMPLVTRGQGQAVPQNKPAQPIFVRLAGAGMTINGRETVLEDLPDKARLLISPSAAQSPFVVSVAGDVSAERLVQTMFQLRQLPKAQIMVVQ